MGKQRIFKRGSLWLVQWRDSDGDDVTMFAACFETATSMAAAFRKRGR